MIIFQDESVDLKQKIAQLTSKMEMMARKKDEMDHTSKILAKSIKQNEMAVEKLKYANNAKWYILNMNFVKTSCLDNVVLVVFTNSMTISYKIGENYFPVL